MRKRLIVIAGSGVAALVMGAAALAPSRTLDRAERPGAVAVAEDDFQIDPAHSTIVFKIRLHSVANFYGRVNAPTGSFLLADDPAKSHVEVTIETKNVDGGLKARNQFLAGVDFFNAREYPQATFKSSSVKQIDEDTWEAVGEFTMRGVTKPLTVQLDQYAEADMGRLGHRAGFEARFTVKRSEFGMTAHLDDGQLGDEVEIIVAIDGARAN